MMEPMTLSDKTLTTLRNLISNGPPPKRDGPPSHSDMHNALIELTAIDAPHISPSTQFTDTTPDHREHHHLLGQGLQALTDGPPPPDIGPEQLGPWHTPRSLWEIDMAQRILKQQGALD